METKLWIIKHTDNSSKDFGLEKFKFFWASLGTTREQAIEQFLSPEFPVWERAECCGYSCVQIVVSEIPPNTKDVEVLFDGKNFLEKEVHNALGR